MAENPRTLKEISEFRDLLNAKDEAMKVAAALTGDASVTVSASATVSVRSGNTNLASPTFNKYLNIWLADNLKLITPELIELLDHEVEQNRQEAEEEASLLGLLSSPILAPAPAITSAKTADAIKGTVFEYIIEAKNAVVGAGITFCEYFVTNAPDWLSFDKARHRLIGNVPASAITNNKVNIELMVTTNVGIATQTLVLTYKENTEAPDSDQGDSGVDQGDSGADQGDSTSPIFAP